MRNPGGCLFSVDPDGGGGEVDSFTCCHCQKVTFFQPKCDPTELGGFCKQCDKLICKHCVADGTCKPWEKQMEAREARARALKSYGLRS